jgi:phage tail protein X
MPIATYRGEKTIGEIADKLFVRLTPKQKEKVEKAILKANPRLASADRVATGTIIRVPDMPELRPKASRALENPDTLLAKHLAEAMDEFAHRLQARMKQASAEDAQQITLLKSAALKRALGNAPGLQALAGELVKTVDARQKDLAAREKSLDTAIRSIREQLSK